MPFRKSLEERSSTPLLPILATMFNHNGALGNIVVTLITVAGVTSSFIRYEYFQVINESSVGTAVYTTVWVTVLFSSLWCSFLYVLILWQSPRMLGSVWSQHKQVWRVAFAMGLGVFGVLALYSLYEEMSIVQGLVDSDNNLHPLWKWIFKCLFYARILQRTLACEQ